jgi:hypothetical protein
MEGAVMADNSMTFNECMSTLISIEKRLHELGTERGEKADRERSNLIALRDDLIEQFAPELGLSDLYEDVNGTINEGRGR